MAVKKCSNKSIKPELLLLFVFNCLFYLIVEKNYTIKPKYYTHDMAFNLVITTLACYRI